MQKMYQKKQLNHNYSTAIKGIAVLLMLVHHGLGLPEQWFENGLGYGQILIGDKMLYEWIGNPTKICVSVFAFLTGWSYFYHNTPTLKYGIKKSLQLLTQYWFVLFGLFYLLGYLISGYVSQAKDIFFNLFSIHNRAVSFSWYVLFYVMCMCTLPLLVKLISKHKVWNILYVPIIFTCVLNGLNHVVMKRWYLLDAIKDYFYWMPIVWVGYMVAKYNVYDVLQEKLCKLSRLIYVIVLIMVPICRGLFLELFCMNMDVIYAPVFVFACVMLLRQEQKIFRCFNYIGEYSMYIWFVHALFFWEHTRKIFQPIAYGVNNIVITLLILFTSSLLISIVVCWMWKIINKIFVRKKIAV